MSQGRRARFIGMVGGGLGLSIGLALFVWQFWLRRPTGRGPVAIEVSRADFDEPWRSREVFLVGMGDSVTAGFGASPGHSYFERLIRTPTNELAEIRGISLLTVFPNLRSTNLAISGSTSIQHERAQLPRLMRQSTNTPTMRSSNGSPGGGRTRSGSTSTARFWGMAFIARSSGEPTTMPGIPTTGSWRTSRTRTTVVTMRCAGSS